MNTLSTPPHPEGRAPPRDRSRRRGESIVFSNTHTQRYFAPGISASSEASEGSHFGFEVDAESSNTSIGTHGVPQRGCLAYTQPRDDVVYIYETNFNGVVIHIISMNEALGKMGWEPHRKHVQG